MSPKSLTALAGSILVLAGTALMAAQAVWPDHFIGIVKQLKGLGITLGTNEVGFGTIVIVIGAILLLGASTGRGQNSN